MPSPSARHSNTVGDPDTEPIWPDDTDILTDAVANRRVAEAWINQFGDLASVAATNRSVLLVVAKAVDPDQACAALKRLLTIHRYGFRALAQRAAKRPLIGDLKRLTAYLQTSMQAEGTIQFRILFLDAKRRLILDEIMYRGTVDQARMYPREVMRRALEVHAAALLVVHNHPWGDPDPRPFDMECAQEILVAARPLGIVIQDYLVVGRHGSTSFQALGLLDDDGNLRQRPFRRRRPPSKPPNPAPDGRGSQGE